MLVDSEIQSLIQIPKRVVEARPKNGMAPDIRNEYSQRKPSFVKIPAFSMQKNIFPATLNSWTFLNKIAHHDK